MKQYNGEKYIVSFTTFGERVKHCEKMLKHFEKQTYKDFHLVITLAKDDLKFIDEKLQRRLDNNELELLVADEDLKSHNKYFYVMQKYHDKPIITIDDDRLYDTDMVEKLVTTHEKNQLCVVANCAIKMRTYMSRLVPLSYWCERLEKNQISHHAMAEGFGGILYPANCFTNLEAELDTIKKCIHDDDIFLKMLEIKHYIPVIATGNPGAASEDNNIDEMQPYNLHNTANAGNINRNNMCVMFEQELLKGFLL